MKTTWIALVGLACVCVAVAQGAPANIAQGAASAPTAKADPEPARIGVLDLQKAITSTMEGQKEIADMTAKLKPRADALQAGQKDLQALETQLQNGKQTLSQQAQDNLTQQIQTKTRDLQQENDNLQQDEQQAQSNIVNDIGGKMMPIINSYAASHGLTMIVDVSFPWPQNPILYAPPSADITQDIVKLYDQAHPAAPVAPAKPAGPGH